MARNLLRRALVLVGSAAVVCADSVAPADASDSSLHHGLSLCSPIQVVTMDTLGDVDLATTAVLLRGFDPVVDQNSWTLEGLSDRFGDEEVEASR